MLKVKNNIEMIKIIDFGLALNKDLPFPFSKCVDIGYTAPEVSN